MDLPVTIAINSTKVLATPADCSTVKLNILRINYVLMAESTDEHLVPGEFKKVQVLKGDLIGNTYRAK